MPVLMIAIVGWIAKFLKDKALGLTMVSVFLGMVAAYLGALALVVAPIVTAAPDFVRDAMAVILPSQWPLQVSTVASIYTLGIAWRMGFQSLDIFAKS